MRRARSWPLALALALSMGLHLALALRAPPAIDPAPAELDRGIVRALGPALAELALERDRRTLIARARAGQLTLGEFLIEANVIDRRAQGRAIDRAEALRLHRARVRSLRARLDRGETLPVAVAEVFGDLHYDLTEGGPAAALLAGGGNCEATSLLVAGAAHDAGRVGQVDLRYWGGASPGRPAHLAPVVTTRSPTGIAGEHDLVAGGPVERGGVRFAAREIVELYAELHDGRTERRASTPGAASDGARPFALYPESADAFAGETPLYAERAVAVLRGGNGAPATISVLDASFGPTPARCWASLHDLAAPELEVWLGASREPFGVELHRLGDASELAADGRELGQFERALSLAEGSERLVQLACLSIVYERASIRFAARSKTALANALLARRRRALAEARELAEELVLPAPGLALRTLEHDAESWMLVVVPELEDALFEHAQKTLKSRPSTLLVALLTHARTRERALGLVDRLPKTTQLALAMALFFPSYTGHHDSLLGSSGDTELARVARAIASVPAGSPEEMLDRTGQAIAAAGVDRSWVDAWDELAAASRSVIRRSLR
jgi:hypothetical protein